MTKIKIFILFVFFGLATNHSHGQAYKFKTSGFSVLEKSENGKWGKWTELELANLAVTLDTDKNRIVIYSQIVQLFNIVTYHLKEENDTDIVHSFSCIDNDDVECVLSIITRKKQNNRKQLYITYGNRVIVYNIFTM